MEDNRKSRRIANDIKFLNDKKVSYGRSRSDIDFYNFGLEITKSLEPELFNSIECVSSRLFINIENIKTFVYPSESIQAECWAFEELCLIRISSTVLDKLNYDEIKFIIGHEIGHYLLEHTNFEIEKPELMIISKAREISCDRLGLIACESYENAISCIIKTQSGLSKINLNISDYLDTSLSNINQSSSKFNYSSHPSLPIRAKSLKLAKDYLLKNFPDYSSNLAFSEKARIDEEINKNFEKYENKVLIDEICESKNGVLSWLWINLSINQNKIEKVNSSKIKDKFGEQFYEKFKRNFNSLKYDEVQDFVDNKLNEGLEELFDKIPYSFTSYVNNELNFARNEISNPEIEKRIHKIKLSLPKFNYS